MSVFSFNVQVKLDVDVSVAPEMEVTSTVASGNSNNSSDSDQSNEIPIATTLSAVSLNSSTATIHPSIENQYKVSEGNLPFDSSDCACIYAAFYISSFSPHRRAAYIGLRANNGHHT